MPLNALGWTDEEDEALVALVKPQQFLYNISDPSRKNILVRETAWRNIADVLSKPVEDCKKRWRGIRDFYMRTKRVGSVHKTKAAIFEKLEFLDAFALKDRNSVVDEGLDDSSNEPIMSGNEEKVVPQNQEYYKITVVETSTNNQKSSSPKIEPVLQQKKRGRKRIMPLPNNTGIPVKILPKPILLNNTKFLRYVEEEKTPVQRSQVIDNLIEKILKENTNEIDVFFRSMASSVKKLQPNLIPKVKMEVCNVIAKYEMQSIDKNFG